jgi:hypothetical protein
MRNSSSGMPITHVSTMTWTCTVRKSFAHVTSWVTCSQHSSTSFQGPVSGISLLAAVEPVCNSSFLPPLLLLLFFLSLSSSSSFAKHKLVSSILRLILARLRYLEPMPLAVFSVFLFTQSTQCFSFAMARCSATYHGPTKERWRWLPLGVVL